MVRDIILRFLVTLNKPLALLGAAQPWWFESDSDDNLAEDS
jgi:hypothetical protein